MRVLPALVGQGQSASRLWPGCRLPLPTSLLTEEQGAPGLAVPNHPFPEGGQSCSEVLIVGRETASSSSSAGSTVPSPGPEVRLGPYTHIHTHGQWDQLGRRLKHTPQPGTAQARVHLDFQHVRHGLRSWAPRSRSFHQLSNFLRTRGHLALLHVDNWMVPVAQPNTLKWEGSEGGQGLGSGHLLIRRGPGVMVAAGQ